MLSNCFQALKAIADMNGHPVDNFKSELKVFETDIERCRSSLMKSSFGISFFLCL